MITLTGNAAASIALRNAIFRVVPGAYVKAIYAKVRTVAVGDAQTLGARRKEIFERLGKMGVPLELVLARVGKTTVEDVGLEDLELLIGLGTAVKSGDTSIDEAFPPVAKAASNVTDLEAKLREQGKKPAAEPPKAETKTEAPGQPCFYCKAPVGPLGVEFDGPEGVMYWKHPACTAFGKGA
jgi:hypothetical protein